MGIEPTSEAWEASILPMNYARMKHVYSITRKKFLQAENFQKSIGIFKKNLPMPSSSCKIIS